MEQLELGYWPKGTLRESLMSYFRDECNEIAEATRIDYTTRINWLLEVFGEWYLLTDITYERLKGVVKEWGPKGRGLKYSTMKKRFVLLRAAMKYAAARKIIAKDDIPNMPKMPNDGIRGGAVHTPTQYAAFRLALPDGRFRFFADIGFYTGHHSLDIFTTQKWMLDPYMELRDETGKVYCVGAYYRRNHKNKHCRPEWFPMDPAFRIIVKAYYAVNRDLGRDSFVVGRLWALSRAFNSACDRAEVPRISPKRLRTSFASNLEARGATPEYVRHALGHEGARGEDGVVQRPTVAQMHYSEVTPELLRRGYAVVSGG